MRSPSEVIATRTTLSHKPDSELKTPESGARAALAHTASNGQRMSRIPLIIALTVLLILAVTALAFAGYRYEIAKFGELSEAQRRRDNLKWNRAKASPPMRG
mgnify:CR=1 FL=1